MINGVAVCFVLSCLFSSFFAEPKIITKINQTKAYLLISTVAECTFMINEEHHITSICLYSSAVFCILRFNLVEFIYTFEFERRNQIKRNEKRMVISVAMMHRKSHSFQTLKWYNYEWKLILNGK